MTAHDAAYLHRIMHMDRADWIRGRGNLPTERAWRRRAGTTGPARARRILTDVATRDRHPSAQNRTRT